MNPKEYAKYDRVFMNFGSVMRGLQGSLTNENWRKVSEEVWGWSYDKVSELVEALYKSSEEEDTIKPA